MKKKMSYGQIYHCAIRRGLDNGYAMYLAEQHEQRKKRKVNKDKRDEAEK